MSLYVLVEDSSQMLAATVDMQTSLVHPNICPNWQLTSFDESIPAIATPMFNNGNVLDFTRQHPSFGKLAIVRLLPLGVVNIHVTLSIQVQQVASAVTYIHAKDIVHGNIIPVCISFTSVMLYE
jgi:hypothetical protein